MARGERRLHRVEGVRERAGDAARAEVFGARLQIVRVVPAATRGRRARSRSRARARPGARPEAGGQLLRHEHVGAVGQREHAVDRVVVGDGHEVHPAALGELVDLLGRSGALRQPERPLDRRGGTPGRRSSGSAGLRGSRVPSRFPCKPAQFVTAARTRRDRSVNAAALHPIATGGAPASEISSGCPGSSCWRVAGWRSRSSSTRCRCSVANAASARLVRGRARLARGRRGARPLRAAHRGRACRGRSGSAAGTPRGPRSPASGDGWAELSCDDGDALACVWTCTTSESCSGWSPIPPASRGPRLGAGGRRGVHRARRAPRRGRRSGQAPDPAGCRPALHRAGLPARHDRRRRHSPGRLRAGAVGPREPRLRALGGHRRRRSGAGPRTPPVGFGSRGRRALRAASAHRPHACRAAAALPARSPGSRRCFPSGATGTGRAATSTSTSATSRTTSMATSATESPWTRS